jgi:hypothetical protein
MIHTFIDKKLDVYTITVNGAEHTYVKGRATAIDTARNYLLTKDRVAVYDSAGNMIYRHAKPYMRQTDGTL